MEKATDRLEFPDGSVYRITKGATATGGEFVEMEMVLPPRAVAPPPHVHPQQDEEYKVVDGTLDVLLDGSWQHVSAGQSIRVPPARVHTFANRSGAVVRLVNTHRPALSFERYMVRLHTLVTSGTVRNMTGPSSLVYVSMLWQEHRDFIVAANPIQRSAMKLLAVLGRVLGCKLP